MEEKLGAACGAGVGAALVEVAAAGAGGKMVEAAAVLPLVF